MLKLDTSVGRAGIVNAAMTEVAAKVREVGGDDLGPKVQEYQRLVGLSPGSPWCAGFVVWCVTKGLGMTRRPKWGRGMAIGNWQTATEALKKRGMDEYYVPALSGQDARVQPGWVFCQGRDDKTGAQARSGMLTKGHTGIVVGLDPKDKDTFITAEGNTDGEGSALGIGVFERHRKFSNTKLVGFFDPVAATVATFNDEQIAALQTGQGVDFARIETEKKGGGITRLLALAAGVYFISKA